MVTKYTAKIHEEAILEDMRIEEDSYCPICGIYDLNLGLGKEDHLHRCCPEVWDGLNGIDESKKEEPEAIKKPSLGTLLDQGFRMMDSEPTPLSN